MFFRNRKREQYLLSVIEDLTSAVMARMPRDVEFMELKRQNKSLRTYKFNARCAMRDLQKAYLRTKQELEILKNQNTMTAMVKVAQIGNVNAKLQQPESPRAQELDAAAPRTICENSSRSKENSQTLT